MKKTIALLIGILLSLSCLMGLTACSNEQEDDGANAQLTEILKEISSLKTKIESLTIKEDTAPVNYATEAYEFIKYIDKNISDRDCISGENFNFAKKWIEWNLFEAGYKEEDVSEQAFTFNMYTKESNLDDEVAPYVTDGKHYSSKGWKMVEDEQGEYVYATLTSYNILATKKGKTDKQIIVGMHYDGDGTGDNGSGIALGLITAMKLFNVETEYTLKFVFFSAEEYGLYGSTYYAENMSDQEVANTLYMINMDSLVCGDYCYLYGGVQNDETKTIEKTEAYDNAQKIATKLGLTFKTNPWTWENPAPGYDEPDYASPSTGDWSDHVGFKEKGITYLYLEGTNWEIPGPYYEYDGYGETYLIGMLMNTPNDYLEYIEKYFPGRIQHHLEQFSTLLTALLTQSDYNA